MTTPRSWKPHHRCRSSSTWKICGWRCGSRRSRSRPAWRGGWFLAPRVLQDLISRTVKHAVVLSPFEMFNERFKLTFILGLSLALPVVFWQAWSFVVPGLLKKERTWVPWLAIGSMILFALGG